MSHPRPSPVLRRVRRSSTIDLVADEIRDAIYRGSLIPGQPISEVRTADLLGVSRPSLREALQRLVSEGSVSHAPGRGAWVRRMGSDDIDEVYAVREAIEVQAVRIIVRQGRSTVLVDEALADLEQAIAAHSARVIGDADLAFHHALVACSGSAQLSTLMKAAMVHTRLLSLSDPRGYEVRCDLIDSHRDLAEAVAAGDGSRAVAIIGRISAEAAARLRDHGAEPAAVVVRGEGREGGDDQWAILRE